MCAGGVVGTCYEGLGEAKGYREKLNSGTMTTELSLIRSFGAGWTLRDVTVGKSNFHIQHGSGRLALGMGCDHGLGSFLWLMAIPGRRCG